MLPNEPVMLMSYLNTLLRDEYETLCELCAALAVSEEEICQKLSTIDYHYSSERNQFI